MSKVKPFSNISFSIFAFFKNQLFLPLLTTTYKPPYLFKNPHFSTLYSAKIRRVPFILQQREKITLPDGDFLHLDWSFSNASTKKVAIVLHGLEGNAQRTYIKGMAYHLTQNKWDAVAMNFRGCSGVVNTKFESYHAGKTDDLDTVVQHVLALDKYSEIALIGFSLGGSVVLKYLGESDVLPIQITKGVAISTPLHLKGSLLALQRPENWLYRTAFLLSLRRKVKEKIKLFPAKITIEDLAKIKTLKDFDDIYTAPAHGFKDAEDYYKKNSSLQFIKTIKKPVLLLNSINDTFLSSKCFPKEFAYKKNNFYLEIPNYGGHVGFHKTNRYYYNEKRAIEFLTYE